MPTAPPETAGRKDKGVTYPPDAAGSPRGDNGMIERENQDFEARIMVLRQKLGQVYFLQVVEGLLQELERLHATQVAMVQDHQAMQQQLTLLMTPYGGRPA